MKDQKKIIIIIIYILFRVSWSKKKKKLKKRYIIVKLKIKLILLFCCINKISLYINYNSNVYYAINIISYNIKIIRDKFSLVPKYETCIALPGLMFRVI